MRDRYIKGANMPPRISLSAPFVWWLILERFDAPLWMFGTVYTLMALLYALLIFRLFNAEAVDVLKDR